MVAVPLYDTLGTEAIGYIIEKGTQKFTFKRTHHLQRSRSTTLIQTKWFNLCRRFFPADISTVICDVPEKAGMVMDCMKGKGRAVKTIVLIEPFDSELVTRGQDCGIEVLSLREFEVRIPANLLSVYYYNICLLHAQHQQI